MRTAFATMAAAGFILCATATADARQPIVAVFNVEAKGVALTDETLDRLSDYLGSTLVATGRYQIVPRSQIKSRLGQQKQDSYKRCYEQSCQIDIGRELAAQKALTTQLIKLGTSCRISLTLYDLKTSTAESAATGSAECTEDALVTALETAVKQLTPASAARSPAPAQAPAPAPAPTPAPAPVASPPTSPSVASATPQVQITGEAERTRSPAPSPSPDEPDMGTIYFLLGLGGGGGSFGGAAFGTADIGTSFFLLRWRWFALTILTANFGVLIASQNPAFALRLGPEIALPIYLARSCLLPGLGAKYEIFTGYGGPSAQIFNLAPSFSWLYRGPGRRVGLGAKLELVFPLTPNYVSGGVTAVASFLLTI